MPRNELYLFRCGLRLSQQEMGAKIGCHYATYAAIENGKRDGSVRFWNNLQRAFGLSDAQKGELMRNEA